MNNKLLEVIGFLLLFTIKIFPQTNDVSKKINEVFVSQEKFINIDFAGSESYLGDAKLSIRILKVKNPCIYLTFPDGGNMVINTGTAEESSDIMCELSEEFKKIGAEHGLLRMFGWKPRVDWIVLTSKRPSSTGGLPDLAKNVEIKSIVVSSAMVSQSIQNIPVVGLKPRDKLDLFQEVSEVDFINLSKNSAAEYLDIKIVYQKYSFLFLFNDIDDSKIADYREDLKNSIIITDKKIDSKIFQVLDAMMLINSNIKVRLITDGKRLVINPILNEIKEKIISKIFEEAKRYYAKDQYVTTIKKTEEILEIEPDYRPAKILNMVSKAGVYFSQEKYEEAKNELARLLEMEPKNKEAKMLLLRIETVQKMMPYDTDY